MSKRLCNPLNKFVLFSLTISVALFLFSFSVSAVTYDIPQTTGVKLTWDHNDPQPEGYRIYQRKSDQAYDYSSPVWTGTSNSAVVYNLEYDVIYNFVVRAYEGSLESPDSDEVSFMAPAPVPTTYSISATTSGSGSISPAGVTTVDEGESQAYTITPDAGYYIADIIIDGVSAGAVASYTFSAVDGDHTITANFETITIVGSDSDNDNLSTDSSNDSTTDAVEEENSGVNIWLEAEDGNITWPMEISDDELASEGGYVWTAEEIQDFFNPSEKAGSVTYDFEIPENDNYVIWARQISNSAQSDSFFLSIDNQDEMVWHTKRADQDLWTWDVMTLRNVGDDRVTTTPFHIWLSAGQHSLTVRQRESGTKVDVLLITSDPILSDNEELVEEYFASYCNENEAANSNSVYELLISYSPDRLDSVQLNWMNVDDNIYVFVDPVEDIKRVEFFIDNMLYQTENYAPFDLAGGASDGLANPFDTRELNAGLHTFSARITKTDGSSATLVADVTVAGYTQLISKSADRTNAYSLGGETVDGDIYVFVDPVEDIKRVEFFIDNMLYQTENYAPFDLAGGASDGLANPFDTRELNAGLHTFSARITKTDGSSATLVADVTVTDQTEMAAGYALLISKSADRSNAYSLNGATVGGNIYVFVDSVEDIKRVEFFIDDMLYQTENYAPFDLAGGATDGLANPINTNVLEAGTHNISAQITKADGTLITIKSSISVSN